MMMWSGAFGTALNGTAATCRGVVRAGATGSGAFFTGAFFTVADVDFLAGDAGFAFAGVFFATVFWGTGNGSFQTGSYQQSHRRYAYPARTTGRNTASTTAAVTGRRDARHRPVSQDHPGWLCASVLIEGPMDGDIFSQLSAAWGACG
jgi:hypothetical protein